MRDVRPVPGEGGGNLSQECDKAPLPYSTAFLRKVLDTVERGLLSAIASGGPVTLSVSATATPSPRSPAAVSVQAEADKAALAFLDSF